MEKASQQVEESSQGKYSLRDALISVYELIRVNVVQVFQKN